MTQSASQPSHFSARLLTLTLAATLFSAVVGCATEPAGTNEWLDLRGPALTSMWYPAQDGREVHVQATVESFGSVMPRLLVMVTSEAGRATAEAPAVAASVLGGPAASVLADGGVAVITFDGEGVIDGRVVALDITVPADAPSPYRIRLVPEFRAPGTPR